MASWPEPSSIGIQGGNPVKTYKLPNEKFEKFVGLKYDWQSTAKDTKVGGTVYNVEVRGSFRLEVTESRWQPSPSKRGGFGTFILKQKTTPSTNFKLQISASAFSFEAKVVELSAVQSGSVSSKMAGKSAAPPSTASSVVIPLESKAERLDEWRQRLEDAKAKVSRSSPSSSVTLSRPEGTSSPNSLRLSHLDAQASRVRSNSMFFQMSEARTMAQPEAEERPMLGLRVSGAGDARVNGTYLPDPDFVGDQPTYRLQPDGDAKIYKLAGTWKLVHNASPGYLYIGDGEHALGAVWTLGGGGRGPVPDFSASTWRLATSHPEPTRAIPQALFEAGPDRERPGLGQRGEDWKSRDAGEARKKLDDGRRRQGAEMEARRKQLEEDRRKREAEAEARRAAQSEKPRQASVVSSRTTVENAKVSTSPSEDRVPSLAALRRDGSGASPTLTDRARVPAGMTATVARTSASTSQIAGQSAAASGVNNRGPTPQLAAAPSLVAAASKLATASPRPAASGAQKPAAKEDAKKDRERELGELMAKRKLEMMQRLATR